MYKSKLQELCHKKNWDLPVYATVKDGADHCPRFTTTVTVQGLTFESPNNVCKSSKESQNMAAKIAFDHFSSVRSQLVSPAINPPSPVALPSPGFANVNLAKNNSILQQMQGQNAQASLADQSLGDDITPKDLHVYKNRLQHYAQKKNLNLPEYSCEIAGPPHARQFRASVKIGGSIYTSPVYFSTLKDSEHAAAKVAFDSLSVGEVQDDEVEIGGESFEGRECKSKKLSEMNAAKAAYNSLMECEASSCFFPGDEKKGNTEVRAVVFRRGANNATETHIDLASMGIGEIRSDYSEFSPGDLKNNAVDVTPSSVYSATSCDLKQDFQSKSMPSVDENDGKAKERPIHGLESRAEKPTGVCPSCGSKIIVYPRQSTVKIPEGATILPCSDDKWVAAKVEGYQQQ